MDTAARNVSAATSMLWKTVFAFFARERSWTTTRAFANALFSVLLLPSGNAAVIRHIGLDDRLISETILHLRRSANPDLPRRLRNGAHRLACSVVQSTRNTKSPSIGGEVNIWARPLVSALNGWSATGKEEANSLGGTWPCAVVTQKGREYVEHAAGCCLQD